MLAFFGYLVKLKFENKVNELDSYMILAVIIIVGLFILGSIFLVLGAKKSRKND